MSDPVPTPAKPVEITAPEGGLHFKPDWAKVIEAKTADPSLEVHWDTGDLVPDEHIQLTKLSNCRAQFMFPAALVKARGTNKFEIGAIVAVGKNELAMDYQTITVGSVSPGMIAAVLRLIAAAVPSLPLRSLLLVLAGLIGGVGGMVVLGQMPGCHLPNPTPIPVPPGPTPPAALTQALRDGLTADGGPLVNRDKLKKLAAAASAVAAGANNPQWATIQDAFNGWAVQVKAQGLAPADLHNLKQGWSAYANARIPTPAATALTPAVRATIAAEFTNLANALNQLTPAGM